MFVPRFVPLVLTGLLAMPATAEIASAPATQAEVTPQAVAPTFQRLGGADRYATAAAVALAAHPSGATTAVIARGDQFPDALTAAPLVAQLHGVLLLTAPNALPAATSSALTQLGVQSVIILGGDGAVSPAVEAQLRTQYAVQRIYGADRYGTAAAVAAKLASLGAIRTVGGHPVAFFVTGSNFPDAVVAGAPAASGMPAPILLVGQNSIPSATAAAIHALHIGGGWILGGEGAVSAATQVVLQTSVGAKLTRLGGSTRQATAVAVARTFTGNPSQVVLARGDEFPDALAAGPYAAGVGAPVLLTDNSTVLGTEPEDAELANHVVTGTSSAVTLVGGTAALTDTVGNIAASAAAGIPPTTDCAARTFVALSPAQRVGQLFMLGVSASAGPDSTTSAAFSGSHVGNVILTGRSSAGVTATRAIVNRVQALATSAATGGIRPFVSTDQEGGEVQVLSGPGFSNMPTALTQGGFAVSSLLADATIWGRQLASAGVNVNLAPVADVVPPQNPTSNQPIGRYYREFGYTPAVVGPHVVAFANGMGAAHVDATLKHFPGLGRASGNTDVTAGVEDTVTTIDDPYLSPFDSGVRAGAPWVMISSAIYTRIDPSTVAMFSSPIVSGLLRGTIGFGGVIVSDSLNAQALVSTPVGSRAADFIAAGGDMALVTVPSTAASMVQGVVSRASSDATFRTRVNDAVLDVLRAKQAAALLPCG